MKRLFLPFILLFILSSCGKTEVKQPVYPISFDGIVSVDYQNLHFSANACTLSDGSLSFELTEPALLKGISMICSSNGTQINKDSISLLYENFEKICPFAELYEVFYQLNLQKPVFTQSEEKQEVQFTYNNSEYTVILNSDKQTIEQVKTPKCIFFFNNEVT